MKSRLFAILFFIATEGYGQEPIANFTFEDNACIGANIPFQNLSTDADKYLWDFCSGDLGSTSLTVTEKTSIGLSTPVGATLIMNEGKWYGFMTNISNNSITRIDFGQSLHNANPTITNLGNYGNLLNGPQDIKAVVDNGQYFLFVSNRTANKLIRINLGADITNPNPAAESILSGNGDLQNNGIEVINDGTNWFAFYTQKDKIVKVKIGSTLSNVPELSDITISAVIVEANNIGDISIVKQEDNWYGFIVGYSSKTIHRLDFGSDLSGEPVSVNLTTPDFSSYNPYGIVLKTEGENHYAFISTQNGNLLRLDFSGSFLNPFTFNLLGKYGVLNNTFKIDIATDNSEWVGLTSNWSSNRIYLIKFPNDCPSSSSISIEENPEVSYTSPGKFRISLVATHANGNVSAINKNITISANEAPSGSLMIDDAYCITTEIDFDFQTTDFVSDYMWNFGDGTNSNDPKPQHTYSSNGVYNISLTVLSPEGCANTYKKEITVYDTPVPEFNTSDISYCSFEPVTFVNSTSGDYGGNI